MSDTLQTNNEKIFESQIGLNDISIDISSRYGHSNQTKSILLHKTTKLGNIERIIIDYCNLNSLVNSNSKTATIQISTSSLGSNSISEKYDVIHGQIQLDKDKKRRLNYCLLFRKAIMKNHFSFKAIVSFTASYTPTYTPNLITHSQCQPQQIKSQKPQFYFYYNLSPSCGFFKDALKKVFEKHNMCEYSNSLIIEENKPSLLFTVHYSTSIRYDGIQLGDEEMKDQFHGNSVWILFHPPSIKKERGDIPEVISGLFLNNQNKAIKKTFVHLLEEKSIDIMREEKEAPKEIQQLLDEDIRFIVRQFKDLI